PMPCPISLRHTQNAINGSRTYLPDYRRGTRICSFHSRGLMPFPEVPLLHSHSAFLCDNILAIAPLVSNRWLPDRTSAAHPYAGQQRYPGWEEWPFRWVQTVVLPPPAGF